MRRRLMLHVLLLAIFLAHVLRGQEDQNAASPKERIYFSAVDKQERPVLGLKSDDFELRLNGRRAALQDFQPGLPHTDRSIPLVLWILLDWNPNISADIVRRQAEAAARAFELFNPDSAIGVKLVSDRSETLQPLARDPAGVRRAFTEFSQRRGVLRAEGREDSVVVGVEGILGAANHAINELVNFSLSDPRLKGKEVHRAIMIISDGNINPYVPEKRLYEKAAEAKVFLYPVLVPRAGPYGFWVEYYFELAKNTGGTASVIGSLGPSSRILPLSPPETRANALTFNFIHMARDLNGKYSFVIEAPPAGKGTRLDVRAKARNVRIRLPRSR